MTMKLSAAQTRALLCCLVLLAGTGTANAASYVTMFGGYPPTPPMPAGIIPKSKPKHDDRLATERTCLAKAIYFEARSESRLGQIAVAQVILNRVKSRLYPNSICKVVWQNSHRRNSCQFSFACDGKPDVARKRDAWEKAKSLANKLVSAEPCASVSCFRPAARLSKAARQSTHYHAVYVRPRWSRRLRRSGRIGRHVFYISRKVLRASRKTDI